MSPFRSIVRMRLASLRNTTLNVKADALTKFFVLLFGLGNVIVIGLWVSYESFDFIENFPAFGAALNAKMIALLFFALLFLVILSTIIVAYTTIFIARETDFLFQHPIPPGHILALKTFEAMAFSSWATLFLCLPVLISFGYLRGAPATYYLDSAVVLMLFLLFAGSAGTSIALILAPVLRRLTLRQALTTSALILGVLGWVFLRSFNIWEMDGANSFLVLDRFTSQLTAMHSPYFPGQWAASAILAAAAGNRGEVFFQASMLLANTLIFIPFLAWYGRRYYGREWLAVRSHSRGGRRGMDSEARAAVPSAETRPAWTGNRGPLVSLLRKDMLVFVRDPAQLSQSLLFFLLMVIYSLSLLRIPKDLLGTEKLRILVHFANLGAVCMILSSFTSRFLFPLLSLEGRAFWIVGLAPVRRSFLIQQKGIFGLVVSWTLGMITIVVSNAALAAPPALFLGAVYSVLLAGVCLTSLSTGLGAAYPAFEEDNPARIAVGLGGTLNFFASALSVAVIIALEAFPYMLFPDGPRWTWIWLSHTSAFTFTLVLTVFCHRLGARSLERRDF